MNIISRKPTTEDIIIARWDRWPIWFKVVLMYRWSKTPRAKLVSIAHVLSCWADDILQDWRSLGLRLMATVHL